VAFDLANLGDDPADVSVTFAPPNGQVRADETAWRLGPRQQVRKTFTWEPSPGTPEGTYRGLLQASARGRVLTRPVALVVPPPRALAVRIAGVAGKDIVAGEGYEIKARLHNAGSSSATVTLACSVVEARRHLPSQEATIEPGEVVEVAWRQPAQDAPLATGEYQVRVTMLGVTGISAVGTFAVRGQ